MGNAQTNKLCNSINQTNEGSKVLMIDWSVSWGCFPARKSTHCLTLDFRKHLGSETQQSPAVLAGLPIQTCFSFNSFYSSMTFNPNSYMFCHIFVWICQHHISPQGTITTGCDSSQSSIPWLDSEEVRSVAPVASPSTDERREVK